MIKEVALEQGVYATFMPKPFSEHPGSGMHTHLSLFEGDRNAFYEAGAELPAVQGRPGVHRRACCAHAAEITAVTNQWVNSYKRLVGGRRGAGVRLLGAQQPLARWSACRCTSRARASRPGSRSAPLGHAPCNPYLAFAVMLAAGLKGIEEGYELPAGRRGRRVGAHRRRAPGDGHRRRCPQSLDRGDRA